MSSADLVSSLSHNSTYDSSRVHANPHLHLLISVKVKLSDHVNHSQTQLNATPEQSKMQIDKDIWLQKKFVQ